MEYHIAKNGNDKNSGSKESPFLTISNAAELARSGDRIIVHAGEYREWVKPLRGGKSNSERIIYQAAPNEKVFIKGSERIQSWKWLEGTVWEAKIPNAIFGGYNPFATSLWGDWLLEPLDGSVHTGEIYLNGQSLYEAKSVEEVKNPVMRTIGTNPPWTNREEKILNPEQTIYQWFAKVEDEETILYANFQSKDPNQEIVEVSVRKCCFYPEKTGIDYITVSGFEMSQAACPWTPPTAEQPALLGVNWGKGWVIENNIIHDAKCSGISIGKEHSTGNNECALTHKKPGYQYQMEAVFKAYHAGWSKETIGSHVIKDNIIFNCGQNGIVGHMGCIFSQILHNHIYNIGVKHEFFGYEIAGIKLHAAIDVKLEENYIENCTLGMWLDWEAQGARISRNLFTQNDRDLFIEVTHGPHLVDNNIFASEYNFDNLSQGGAYIHNLFCGTMRREPVLDRSTPYHFPHSTAPLGTAFVYSGDDRWYNNIFLGGQKTYTDQSKAGTKGYHGHPDSIGEYLEELQALGTEDQEKYRKAKQPVFIKNNCYLNGAEAYEKEAVFYESDEDPQISIEQNHDKVYLNILVSEGMVSMDCAMADTYMLGMPRITEERFENPDGSDIVFNQDYNGEFRQDKIVPGPFAKLQAGWNQIRLW